MDRQARFNDLGSGNYMVDADSTKEKHVHEYDPDCPFCKIREEMEDTRELRNTGN